MSQMGVRSTGSRLQARRKRSSHNVNCRLAFLLNRTDYPVNRNLSSGERRFLGVSANRLIGTKRVALKRISGVSERPRPAAAARVVVFALAALPLELRDIAQLREDLRVSIDVHDVLGVNVSGFDRQEARGVHVAEM